MKIGFWLFSAVLGGFGSDTSSNQPAYLRVVGWKELVAEKIEVSG